MQAKLADLEKQLAAEAERPTAVRKQLTEAKRRQDELAAELKLPAPEGEPASVVEARRWRLDTQGLALSNEIRMLDEELLSRPVRVALLEAQRDRTANSVEWLLARVKLLENTVSERRRAEAEESEAEAEEAKREALGKHPLVQRLAAENAALSEEFTALAVELERVSGEDQGAIKEAKRIADDLRSAQQRLEIAGLSRRFGELTAVDNISFAIPRGVFFGFLGPNGAGKTTTLRMMTGLLPPSAGEVFIEGLSITEDAVAVKRPVRLGYTSDGMVEITDGIAPGEQVVVAGHTALKEKSPLEVLK